MTDKKLAAFRLNNRKNRSSNNLKFSNVERECLSKILKWEDASSHHHSLSSLSLSSLSLSSLSLSSLLFQEGRAIFWAVAKIAGLVKSGVGPGKV